MLKMRQGQKHARRLQCTYCILLRNNGRLWAREPGRIDPVSDVKKRENLIASGQKKTALGFSPTCYDLVLAI